MDRRTAIKFATAAAILPAAHKPLMTGGWIESAAAKAQFRTRKVWGASSVDRDIRGSGQNKVVRLWKIWEQVAGQPFSPHIQEIGDCGGHAMALGLETQSAVSIASGGKYKWQGKLSTEAIYIASRIEIGRAELGYSDGTSGAWLVQAAERYGVLPRANYGRGFDVSSYNPGLARQLSAAPEGRPGEGIPQWLEPEMKKNTLLRGVLIDGGFDQAADFVANGYPILLCSGVGFRLTPDGAGFLRQAFLGWNHAAVLWGIDTRSKRQGGCIANSWGSNWTNPGSTHKYGTPSGCFWADRRAINNMLDDEDSYALVEYHGPQIRDLDYSILSGR